MTDSERLDWMELHLQRPADVVSETGPQRTVNCWALVGEPGRSLRETIDRMAQAKAKAAN